MAGLEGIDFSQLEKLITVQAVAEMFEVPPRVVRKAARNNEIPGAIKILGKLGFDPEQVTEWEPPEPGERRGRVTREDGRQRYRIYLSEGEYAVLAPNYEVVDPRIAARAKRAERKAAAEAGGSAPAAAGGNEPDPFGDFEA